MGYAISTGWDKLYSLLPSATSNNIQFKTKSPILQFFHLCKCLEDCEGDPLDSAHRTSFASRADKEKVNNLELLYEKVFTSSKYTLTLITYLKWTNRNKMSHYKGFIAGKQNYK